MACIRMHVVEYGVVIVVSAFERQLISKMANEMAVVRYREGVWSMNKSMINRNIICHRLTQHFFSTIKRRRVPCICITIKSGLLRWFQAITTEVMT